MAIFSCVWSETHTFFEMLSQSIQHKTHSLTLNLWYDTKQHKNYICIWIPIYILYIDIVRICRILSFSFFDRISALLLINFCSVSPLLSLTRRTTTFPTIPSNTNTSYSQSLCCLSYINTDTHTHTNFPSAKWWYEENNEAEDDATINQQQTNHIYQTETPLQTNIQQFDFVDLTLDTSHTHERHKSIQHHIHYYHSVFR